MQFLPAEHPWTLESMKFVLDGELFFVKEKEEKCRETCHHAGHVPSIYQGSTNYEWIFTWNYKKLSERLPSEWLLSTEPYDGRSKIPDGFRQWWVEGYERVPVFIKDTISTEDVNRLWDGCSLLARTGKTYIYVVVDSKDASKHCKISHDPPKNPSLKDIYISTLLDTQNFTHFNGHCPEYWAVEWNNTYSEISNVLTKDLKEEIQKRACPWKQIKMGCFDAVRTWHPTGQLCQEIPLNDQGQYHGEAMMYDRKGKKVVSVHFKDGQQHGSCTVWNPDREWGGRPVSVIRVENDRPIRRVEYGAAYVKDNHTSRDWHEYGIVQEEVFLPGKCPCQMHSVVRSPKGWINHKHLCKEEGHNQARAEWHSYTFTGPIEKVPIDDLDVELLHRDDSFPCSSVSCYCEMKRIREEITAREEKEKGPPRKKQRIK